MTPEDIIKYVDELRAADFRAVQLAKVEVDRRLEAMNELRDQINHERGIYVTATRYEERHQALIDYHNADVKGLNERIAQVEKFSTAKEAIDKQNVVSRHIWVLQAGVIVAVLGIFVPILIKALNI